MDKTRDGNRTFSFLTVLAGAFALTASAYAAETVFADFEGGKYPDGWTVEGNAFGNAPAGGTLQHQQKVSGFIGKGLVNTFYRGDRSTGTLTSAEFTLAKKAINFRIGGGCHPGTCCLNLLVDGKIVRTATGANNEYLDVDGWDVAEFIGRRARLSIVDKATGRWGHINVDHIVFSDVLDKKVMVEVRHAVASASPFVLVPVDNSEPNSWRFEIFDGEKRVRFWNIGWGVKEADWYAPLDLSAFAGRTLSFRIVNRSKTDAEKALAQLRFAAKPEWPANVYDEPKRAQLRLSPTLGWTNDPNGLSYYNGEYHVFYQHNPCGRTWQNMTWGHFVSKDLVHWRDVGDVIHPDALGPMFSGSAVTDRENTAGFGKNAHVLAYTAAGNPAVQCLAYSTDGRHYVKYTGNPVVKNITGGNRDPKVFWHAPSRQWVQCLYVGSIKRDGAFWHTFHIFNSPDLKDWKLTDIVYGDKNHKQHLKDPEAGMYLYECPDLVELKIEGTDAKSWVIWGASGEYGVGSFDGSKFTASETGIRPTFNQQRSGSNRGYYAAQSFADDPKGRTVWVPWMKLETKDANFNQGFGIPMSLSLRKTCEGVRLVFDPVEEYKTLRIGAPVPFEAFDGELAEAFFEADVDDETSIVFDLRGEKLLFDAKYSCMTLPSKDGKKPTTFTWKAKDGRLAVRFFIDRLGLEVLSQDGLQLAPFATYCPDAANRSLSYTVRRGRAANVKTRVYNLKSIWK